MANKKINELLSRTPSLTDLMLIGDPSSGYSYKCTVNDIALEVENIVAGSYVTLATAQTISGAKTFSNVLTLTSVANSAVDTDKFLVLTASNTVNYRTGAEVLSDIGGVGGSGTTNYLPKFSAATTLANSQIFDNGTNIGIATATPDATARVQINKTDGYGLFLNYTTNTGTYPSAAGLYLLNTTLTGGYAAMIEEKTPVNNAGQYPILISHTLSSGTAQSGMATGIHFGLPNDAGVLQRTQMSIDTVDPAAATYTSRYRFMVRYNNASTAGMYITGTGVGILTIPTVALDVNGEAKFSTINNATTDTDRFLVSDSGVIKYRTGAEVLSDIGAQPSGSYVPTTRTLTINGTAYDLSADRTWSVGTVTSVSATAGTGISISGSPITSSGTLTITNTAPDQTVVLTSGTGINVTGTYPSFTIAATNNGTVTSVALATGTTGTDISVSGSPITSSGTITLNIPTASATNRGALSSTDWTTFNNKQNAITLTTTGTSGAATLVGATLNIPNYTLAGLGGVSGSGTTNYIPKFTSSSAIGNSVFTESGGNTLRIIAANAAVRFSGSNEYLLQTVDADGRFRIYDQTAALERVTLTSSGNLGLGVTPSAWTSASGRKAIEIGALGNAMFGNGASDFYMLSNAFTDGTFKYANNGPAAYYRHADAEHRWGIAPSGTAGNAISFTQAMTLDASGRLGIGTTSPAYPLDVNGDVAFNGAIRQRYLSAIKSSNYLDASRYTIQTVAGYDIAFEPATVERMRITAAGELLIGTTTDAGAYLLQVAGKAYLNTTGAAISTNSAATDAIWYQLTNTGGTSYFGRENSAGTSFSASAYATVLYSTGARNMEFFTNSLQRMTITSGGNVGIGTTSPVQKLHIDGGASFSYLHFSNANTGSTDSDGVDVGINTSDEAIIWQRENNIIKFGTNGIERMRITSGGNVGIGYTSPGEALSINGNLAVGASSSSTFKLYVSGNTYLSGSTNYINGTTIFQTSGASEISRFTSSGELLINTTTDAGDYKLQVNGNSYFNGSATINATTGNNDLVFLATTRPSIFVNSTNIGLQIRTNGTGVLELNTDNSSTGDVNINNALIYVDASASNVGIGTNAPSAKLEVNGAIKTAAPSGGTAQAWRLGSVVAGSVTNDANNYVEVEINGTAYKLCLATPS